MTLATWITLIRFILAPFIFWQMITRTMEGVIWAIIMLVIAAISDLVDGWVARARNEISELGKALDPLSDKLLIIATLLSLVWWGLPGWLVAIYLIKETIQVLAGVLLFKKVKQLIPANIWGKSATFCFFTGFGLFFIHHLTGFIVLTVGVALSIYAFFTYYQVYLDYKNK